MPSSWGQFEENVKQWNVPCVWESQTPVMEEKERMIQRRKKTSKISSSP